MMTITRRRFKKQYGAYTARLIYRKIMFHVKMKQIVDRVFLGDASDARDFLQRDYFTSAMSITV